jgi:hypothetical protein
MLGSPEAELQPLEKLCGTSGGPLGDTRRTLGIRKAPWRTSGGHLNGFWKVHSARLSRIQIAGSGAVAPGGALQDLWKTPGRHPEDLWETLGKPLEDPWRTLEWPLEGPLG